jgi:hypothetical protein
MWRDSDLVDYHRGAGLAQLAFPCAEPGQQLLARDADRDGGGIGDDGPPVLPQDDPAEVSRTGSAAPLRSAGPGVSAAALP